MKKLLILFVVALSFHATVTAQNKLKDNLTALKGKIGEVKVDKTVFNQSLDVVTEEIGKLVYTSTEVDEKGKSTKEVYEFFLSDIDKNTVIRKPSGKKMQVSLSTTNGLKFVKHLKEDKLDGYTSSFEILVAGSDEATTVINLITSSIPLVKQSDKNWNTPTDALTWIKDNLGQVTTPSGNISQTFGYDAKKNYLVSYATKKTDSKGASTEEKYDFNLLDINKNDIKVKVSGTNLTVVLGTKGGDRFIKYLKNGALQSYQNDVEISAADIEQARNVIGALTIAITKSKAQFPEFQNSKQALDFITTNISKVDIDTKSVNQKIEFADAKGIKASFHSAETDSKGKTIESLYELYFNDIEENSIACKVSGKKISISFVIKNKQKLIRYSKENVIQSYEYDLDMLSDNLETARCVIEAMKYTLKNTKAAPESFSSMNAAMEFLKNNLGDIKTPSDQYKQTFAGTSIEPFKCQYSFSKTDAKSITIEESFEFYPYMMDPNLVSIKSAGKYLTVNMLNRDKKSFIKRYKNKEQQSYDNELEIMTMDAKQAKDIAEALKYIATNGKLKEKTYTDKQGAINFIISQVGNFKGNGKEVKQKLEMVSNDPCKLNLNITTTDDKGKNTEEIYEFSMSDINKLAVDYKISGKNVSVVLITKNKSKLVKAYKNGAQQAFGTDVEILEDDVNTAKTMVDAFKALAGLCEQ